MKRIRVKTRERIEMVDITGEVQAVLSELKLDEGICVVYSPHTTAGLVINEHADPDVAKDIMNAMKEQYPLRRGWLHTEGNADAHVKAALLGSSVSIPVTGGRLALGTWQGIFFCECDGPRSREVYVQAAGAK